MEQELQEWLINKRLATGRMVASDHRLWIFLCLKKEGKEIEASSQTLIRLGLCVKMLAYPTILHYISFTKCTIHGFIFVEKVFLWERKPLERQPPAVVSSAILCCCPGIRTNWNHTQMYAHNVYIYIYVYMCVCPCMCIYVYYISINTCWSVYNNLRCIH